VKVVRLSQLRSYSRRNGFSRGKDQSFAEGKDSFSQNFEVAAGETVSPAANIKVSRRERILAAKTSKISAVKMFPVRKTSNFSKKKGISSLTRRVCRSFFPHHMTPLGQLAVKLTMRGLQECSGQVKGPCFSRQTGAVVG